MNKKVGIVVVTYNRLKLLQEEIDALRNQTYKDHQIVVVNNSSTDGTLEWLEGQDDIITITQGNVGGAGGFFTGMKYVAEHGYNYCWVMDDDVICNPDALEKLVVAFNKHPEAGYICSKVVATNGEPMNVPILDMRKGETDYTYWINESDEHLLRVMKSTFVSALFPVSIIKEVGLPYKEYFIWGDDWEYTQRISTKHVCFLSLESIVVHKRAIQKRVSIEHETNSFRLQNYVYMFRNMAFNSIKYNNISRLKITFGMFKATMSEICKGNLKSSKIRFKALSAFIKFNPVVQFPK